MRSCMHKILVGVTAVLMVAACGPNNKDAASPDTTATHTIDKQGEGALVDVNAELLRQGFQQGQISAVETNAAYWLMPKMGQKPAPGHATCIFIMVHEDYKKGDAYADHRIKENSPVRLTGYLVGSDGEKGASLPKTPVVEFSKLSPAWLAAADQDFGGLGVCGDLTVK